MARHRPRLHAAVVFPIIMLVLGIGAGVTIASLQNRADSSRRAQVEVGSLRFSIQELHNAAFAASPQSGGSPTVAHALIVSDEAAIIHDVHGLMGTSPPKSLAGVGPELRTLFPVVHQIYEIGAYGGGYNGLKGAEVNGLQATAAGDVDRLDRRLVEATAVYASRAGRAKTSATVGAVATIAILLLAFGLFYFRSVRARSAAEALSVENTGLLRRSQRDALTDALTRLPNRRALTQDLDQHFERGVDQATLCLFDLDGFKLYNDNFGHGAGDALLERLGAKLAAAVQGAGKAYRMGGDEFCVLLSDGHDEVQAAAVAALSESGDGWEVGPSAGSVRLPAEAGNGDDALQVADERMYADKAARKGSGGRLGSAWAARDFADRAAEVGSLAARTATALGLPGPGVEVIRAAAKMYNVGLRAVPTSIVRKPGPLDPKEWAFVRRHPIVGERMIAAATLTEAAVLVRSAHEWADGDGYPDGLRSEQIPLGSRVIAVCGAFVAMTSPRCYAAAMTTDEALAELARQAGSQFDPDVVKAFSQAVQRQPAA